MSHFYPIPWEGPEEEITMIRSSRFFDELIEPIRLVLERHGAQLEVFNNVCLIHFPAGTVRRILYPIIRTERYKVTLPDRYYLYESTGFRGQSIVRFVLDEFPEWVQQKYGPSEKEEV